MARMIPPLIHPTVCSGAERRIFELLRNAPNTEDWICLHSLALARHETKRRAEIDFLLLTKQGIFVLEVKGGRISRSDGLWHFTDRWGNCTSKSESPFDQAASAMFALEKEVRGRFADHDRRRRLLFGFGAMFPDITFDATGVEIDQRQLYDRRWCSRPITTFVDGLAAYWRERSEDKDGRPTRYAPTDADIKALLDFLRGDFDLIPPLGARADESIRHLVSLEKEQYSILDGLELVPDPRDPNPRFIIQGGAGTGKTLLAAEVARREAHRTKGRILLICFNRVLQSVLEHTVRPYGDGEITVKSIGVLLNELVETSSFADEYKKAAASADGSTVYKDILPAYATNALLEGAAHPYTALVIDEAQDMMSRQMLDLLDAFVDGGFKRGRWWVFCDINNQESVYGVFEREALFYLMGLGRVSVLPTNRRNTIPIANETDIVTCPQFPPKAVVDGVPVTTRFCKPSEQLHALSAILRSLLREDVAPYRITVLSPRNARECCAARLTSPKLTVVDKHNGYMVGSPLLDSITYCTVSSFKGLENDFIVLTDVEHLNSDWWKGVVYVGMTRARVGLYVLMYDSLRAAYSERQQAWLRNRTGTL